MKELRDGERTTATRSMPGSHSHISSEKHLRDQELSHLQHLVSSSVPSPPYGGLTLLNPTALFGADPSAMFSAHLLASIAASNPNARFQLPIPISLGVSAPATQIYHPTSTGPNTNGLPSAQLDILSSWMKEHSASKEDRKIPTISSTKNSNKIIKVKKQRDTNSNWALSKMKNNKRNKSSAQIENQRDLISSENCINKLKRETDLDNLKTPLIIETGETGKNGKKIGHIKVEKNGDTPQPTHNNNNQNNVNLNSVSVVTMQQTIQSQRDKVFTCATCNRSFSYKHVLQNHERTHTGEKPFGCNICHNRFTRDHHLKTHMRLHTGEKPYRCTHCDRQFVQVANLRRHLRVHTGERPYACDLCESRFSDSNQLKAHMLIHKGEKPFSCTECGSSYRLRHHLNVHNCSNKNNNHNNKNKISPSSSFPGSPPEISPTAQMKRERKSKETRRIIRMTGGLPVATVTTSNPMHGSFGIPVGPEQTHPEDLSLGNNLRNRHFSGSHSSCSASPSPLSGGSHGSMGPYCRSITSSDPPEYSSEDDERRTVAAADTTNGGKCND